MSTLCVLISILMEPKCLCCWVEAKLILSSCPPVVMFWFLFSIIPFLDLFYNNNVLLASAKLAESLLWMPTSWCHLIPICLLDFSPPPFLAPSGSRCGQTHPVPFTRTQEHMFTHPHNQPHPGLHFHTITHIQSLPFTITQPHSHNHLQQSHSLAVLLTPTESYSHSRPGTPLTSIQSCTVSFSPVYTHTLKSAHSVTQSLTRIQSLCLLTSQSLTRRQRATFILSAIHTLHSHTPSNTKSHKIPGSDLVTLSPTHT